MLLRSNPSSIEQTTSHLQTGLSSVILSLSPSLSVRSACKHFGPGQRSSKYSNNVHIEFASRINEHIIHQASVNMLRISLAAFALSFMGRSLFAQAQLASCADIGCPALYNTSCPLPGLEEGLSWLGIASFKTMLSSEPLSWTVGESFRHLQRSHDNLQAELMFYLGQPPSLNLQANTSVTACALFFEGIAPRLGSNNSQGIAKNTSASDTCDDALTARCASDLRSHAQSMTGGLNGVGLSCQSLADRIRSAPPDSCRVAKGSWGTVQARSRCCRSYKPSVNTDNAQILAAQKCLPQYLLPTAIQQSIKLTLQHKYSA